MTQDLQEAIANAAECISGETNTSAWRVFEELVPSVFVRTPDGLHAVGVIEGAALALGVTPIELLDDLEIPDLGHAGPLSR